MTEGKIVSLKYPVFGLDWQRDPDDISFVAIAGGGGSAKSGIKNCVTLARLPHALDTAIKPTLVPFHEIDTGDDLVSGVSIGTKGGLVALTMGNKTVIYRVRIGSKTTSAHVTEFQTDFAKDDSYQSVLRFSPDGTKLATGGEDGTVRVWELTIPDHDDDETFAKGFKATEVAKLDGHSGCISGLSWHATNTKLLTCAKDGQCFLWALTDNKKKKTWTKTGKLGLAGELALQKLDAKANRGKFIYRACHFHLDEIVTLQTPARGSSYLTKWAIGDGGKLFSEVASVPIKDVIVCSMAINLRYIACGSSDGQLLLFTYDALRLLKTISAHYLPSTGLAFIPPMLLDPSDHDDDRIREYEDDLTVLSGSADYSLYLVSGFQPTRWVQLAIFLLVFLYLAFFAYLGESWK
ncbi:hypothetical protein SDRG_08965 [Saprolegnia diclina VS20]|uniref:Uncharacterized protein n=1 Tax=Saprolegnia diclina (strain VS20) TaxID=1156394 RepID=T0RMD6_SAPDV|nr:hypothetical protein SDRG_08965 [Saprolegnia diclina VS20]EQC33453.1 hypothetical protein SDRG_08965 [Saprolegnia diclina VS20]|eukprot:XP_008613093.1 hypothetical protein SDRG_08965 [Saprolegnia diclina VS20]